MPTPGQLLLLALSIALFAAGGVISVACLWWDKRTLRIASRCCLGSGIVTAIGVIIWHAAHRRNWVPIGDNFDALIWLATLLAMFVLYVQRHRTLGALDWFVMPLVIVLLVIAGIFGMTEYHAYHSGVDNAWAWVHRVTAYGGAVAFAIAAGCGAENASRSRTSSGAVEWFSPRSRRRCIAYLPLHGRLTHAFAA